MFKKKKKKCEKSEFCVFIAKIMILFFILWSFNILLKDFNGESQLYSPWFFEPAECELATTDVVKLSIVMSALWLIHRDECLYF